MRSVSPFEVGSAVLSLPPTGLASLISLGGSAVSLLWMASRTEAVSLDGGDPLRRFEQAAALGARLLEASPEELAYFGQVVGGSFRKQLRVFAKRRLSPGRRAELLALHTEISDGVAAAFCGGTERDGVFQQARQQIRGLMLCNGRSLRVLRREALLHRDEGLRDAAWDDVSPRRFVRDGCYRAGVRVARTLTATSRIEECRAAERRIAERSLVQAQVHRS